MHTLIDIQALTFLVRVSRVQPKESIVAVRALPEQDSYVLQHGWTFYGS